MRALASSNAHVCILRGEGGVSPCIGADRAHERTWCRACSRAGRTRGPWSRTCRCTRCSPSSPSRASGPAAAAGARGRQRARTGQDRRAGRTLSPKRRPDGSLKCGPCDALRADARRERTARARTARSAPDDEDESMVEVKVWSATAGPRHFALDAALDGDGGPHVLRPNYPHNNHGTPRIHPRISWLYICKGQPTTYIPLSTSPRP
jgi:hypothetical protein